MMTNTMMMARATNGKEESGDRELGETEHFAYLGSKCFVGQPVLSARSCVVDQVVCANFTNGMVY